jgi:hypothetical protein
MFNGKVKLCVTSARGYMVIRDYEGTVGGEKGTEVIYWVEPVVLRWGEGAIRGESGIKVRHWIERARE